jgi:DNA invertase Pin-like site-specific DNA recombinase
MLPERAGLVTGSVVGEDRLLAWAQRSGRRPVVRALPGGLRFAFYGRVSTEDHQDPVTSQARQRDQATALVAGYGRIVAEYFDAGQSRVLPWARRPQAAALVAAMADPDREFDAIVTGEYERAFCGSQYALMAPLFGHYGVQLWMPEAGGRVDLDAEGDEQLMISLGLQSKREITRTKIRVRTAMAAQARDQGRYLGGRPPYGYRLADAGSTRTRRTRPGADGPGGWTQTRRPRRWCGGCSPSGGPGAAWPGSLGHSTTRASPARRRPTRAAMRTGPGRRGR